MIAEPDVEATVEEWKADLAAFFENVKEWVRAMEPAPTVESRTITLDEPRSGPYTVEELVLTSGRRRVVVRPIARWIVGADGRVDLQGSGGPMILVHHQGQGWSYLSQRPIGELYPLGADLFRKLVDACWE